MIAHDLRHKSQAKACAGRLVGHEGVEQMGADFVGDAAAVVAHRHDQRQVDLGLLTRHREAQSMTECGREFDLAVAVARHLAGVLHEIEEYLDELVAIAEHVRQRRIVALDEAHVLAEAVLRQAADVIFQLLHLLLLIHLLPLVQADKFFNPTEQPLLGHLQPLSQL